MERLSMIRVTIAHKMLRDAGLNMDIISSYQLCATNGESKFPIRIYSKDFVSSDAVVEAIKHLIP